MKLNFGYPGLCLFLFFPLLIVSCAVKRTGEVNGMPVAINDTTVYQLQVKLIVRNELNELQGEFTPYMVHPYNARYWHNNLLIGSQSLILYFRFPDMEQLQQCREQLLNTGQVEQISITKLSNL